MSFKIIAATLLLALPAASADTPLPQLRVEPTTGGSIFYVHNTSSQPLTAYVIELVDYPGSYFALWQDEITSEPIAPDKEKAIKVDNMTVGAAPDYVKIRGAVYADGETAGLPVKVTQLLDRRRFMLETVRALIERLEKGPLEGATAAVASANLTRAAQFMVLPPGVTISSQIAVNQQAGKTLYYEAAHYLEGHSMEDTLVKIHDWEKAILESKPAL